MDKAFTPFVWENKPSMATPLGKSRLNPINTAIDTIDNRVIALDIGKLNVAVANSMLAGLDIDTKAGIIKATQLDGTVYTWDFNLEKIPAKLYLTADAVLIMETDDGEVYEADLKSLIDTYVFDDSDTVAFVQEQIEDIRHVTAKVKNGSITREHLTPDYLTDIENQVNAASGQAELAGDYAELSKRYAVGGVAPEDINDNSKWYYEQCQILAEKAEQTVDLNLPQFHVDINTMHLIGDYTVPFEFMVDENGHLITV